MTKDWDVMTRQIIITFMFQWWAWLGANEAKKKAWISQRLVLLVGASSLSLNVSCLMTLNTPLGTTTNSIITCFIFHLWHIIYNPWERVNCFIAWNAEVQHKQQYHIFCIFDICDMSIHKWPEIIAVCMNPLINLINTKTIPYGMPKREKCLMFFVFVKNTIYYKMFNKYKLVLKL